MAADEQAKEASRLQAFEVRFRNEHEREPTPFEIRFYRWADKGKDWMKSSPFSLPLIIMLVVVGSITSMELNTPDLSFVPNYTYYTVSKAGNAGITPPRAVRDLQVSRGRLGFTRADSSLPTTREHGASAECLHGTRTFRCLFIYFGYRRADLLCKQTRSLSLSPPG